jgi:hypothetical protein
MMHALKIWPDFFAAVVHSDPDQRKTVESRAEDDKYFTVGDEIIF